MIEDPRDNSPEDDDLDDEVDEDEILLEELEGDAVGFFGITDSGSRDSDGEPDRFPDPGADPDFDDDASFDELPDDASGFFEVSAAPGQADAPEEDQHQFEVQATSPAAAAGPAAAPPPRSVGAESDNIHRLGGVEVEVIATLGTTRMHIRDILGLQVGSVVELHRMVGEPVDVTLNGRLIARGEVVVVDEKFAIRVQEITGGDD